MKFPTKMKPLLLSCDMGALCPSFSVGLINVIAVSVYGIFKAELFKRLYLSFWFFFFDFWKMFFSGLLLLLILSSSFSYYSTHTACKTVKLVLIGHMTVSYHMITYGLNLSNCLKLLSKCKDMWIVRFTVGLPGPSQSCKEWLFFFCPLFTFLFCTCLIWRPLLHIILIIPAKKKKS